MSGSRRLTGDRDFSSYSTPIFRVHLFSRVPKRVYGSRNSVFGKMCEISGSANWWQYVMQQTAWKVVAAAALGNVIAAAIRVRAVCGNPHGAADVPRDCRASAARGVQEVGKHHEIWALGQFREHVALEDSEARLEVQGGMEPVLEAPEAVLEAQEVL